MSFGGKVLFQQLLQFQLQCQMKKFITWFTKSVFLQTMVLDLSSNDVWLIQCSFAAVQVSSKMLDKSTSRKNFLSTLVFCSSFILAGMAEAEVTALVVDSGSGMRSAPLLNLKASQECNHEHFLVASFHLRATPAGD